MRSRIAYRLAAIWLAVAVPLVLILAASYVERYETRVARIQQERLGYARLSAVAFSSLIDGARRTMTALGAQAPELEANPEVGTRRLQRIAMLYPATYVVLADNQGRVVAASDKSLIGRDYSDNPAFKQAQVEDAGIEPSSMVGGDTPGFHIAQRILVEDDRPLGTMLMRIDVRRLHDEYPLDVPAGGISVIDSSGQVVYQSESEGLALKMDRWGDRFPFVRRALEGRTATSRSFGFPLGGTRIGAFVPVERIGWAAGSSVESRVSLESLWESAEVTLTLALAVALGGLIVSLWVSRGLRRSLVDLAEDAQTIGSGDLSKPVRVSRNDEIGIVAESLEHSRQNLQSYEEENLELLVRQKYVSDLNAAAARIATIIHSSLDFRDALRDVLEASATALGCDSAGINLWEDEHWVRVALYGLPQEFLGEKLTDEQNTVAALVRTSKRHVVIDDAANDERIEKSFVDKYGIKSLMAFPLLLRDEVFGILFFNYLTEARRFTLAQVDFAINLATSLSLAYDNARLYESEHNVAEKLQSALLALPKRIVGVDFAVRYKSASDRARVGGDFYDLFPTGSGGIGLTIGDISGHGIDAAVLTSLVKTAVRVRASEAFPSPGDVLHTANQILYNSSDTESFATVLFALFDPLNGNLAYSNGGHTTGAIVSRRAVRPLPTNSPLVGAFPDVQFAEGKERLAEDELLFLYTDGIVEARVDEGELYGEERLFTLLSELYQESPEGAADRVFEAVSEYAGGDFTDDIAILVVKRSPDQPPAS